MSPAFHGFLLFSLFPRVAKHSLPHFVLVRRQLVLVVSWCSVYHHYYCCCTAVQSTVDPPKNLEKLTDLQKLLVLSALILSGFEVSQCNQKWIISCVSVNQEFAFKGSTVTCLLHSKQAQVLCFVCRQHASTVQSGTNPEYPEAYLDNVMLQPVLLALGSMGANDHSR